MGRCRALAVLFLALATCGCMPGFDHRPGLPTAIPGVLSNSLEYQTPVRRAANDGETSQPVSTPAPWATPLPATPVPVRLPPPVPHDLAGKTDCLSCHKGTTYYRIPADHAKRTNQTCRGCHAVSSGPPPRIPHTTVGREGCLVCHLQGTQGARPVPGDHAGRLNDTCNHCHSVRK